MAQAVSRPPLTPEACVCFRVNSYGICGGQSGTGTAFLRVVHLFSLIIISLWLSILICHLGDEQ
jgi:hypothetical protein